MIRVHTREKLVSAYSTQCVTLRPFTVIGDIPVRVLQWASVLLQNGQRHHQVANESSTVRAVQKAERRSAHGESVPVDSQEVQLNGKSRCKPSLSENDVLLQ